MKVAKANLSPIRRLAFLALGYGCMFLGFIGVFLPVLPTTPFLLLAAFAFLRSSPKMLRWMLRHKVLGIYLRGYLRGNGIPLRAKCYTLALLWASILTSAHFFIPVWPGKLTLILIAFAVSFYILFKLPTLNRVPPTDKTPENDNFK